MESIGRRVELKSKMSLLISRNEGVASHPIHTHTHTHTHTLDLPLRMEINMLCFGIGRSLS